MAAFRLVIVSGTASNASFGCTLNFELPVGAWSHVVLSHASANFVVFVNGQTVCSITGAAVGAPVNTTGEC